MASHSSEAILLNYSLMNNVIKNRKYVIGCFQENDPSIFTNHKKTKPKSSKIHKSWLIQAPFITFV